MNIQIHRGKKLREEPVEVFCFDCRQLRLSFVVGNTNCHNCGSRVIKVGKLGELDKEALLKQCQTTEKKEDSD